MVGMGEGEKGRNERSNERQMHRESKEKDTKRLYMSYNFYFLMVVCVFSVYCQWNFQGHACGSLSVQHGSVREGEKRRIASFRQEAGAVNQSELCAGNSKTVLGVLIRKIDGELLL